MAVKLDAGKNTLAFTRTVPEDFEKEGFTYAGPEFGWITMRTFRLVKDNGES